MTNIDQKKLNKARELSRSFHKEHFRISGENYFNHVEKVVNELKYLKTDDTDLYIAAYLHHFLEMDKNSGKLIKENFGEKILKFLVDYRKLAEKEMPSSKSERFDESVFIKTFINLVNDPKMLILRLVDKAENIKTAHTLDKEKSKVIAHKALNLYAPLCRLVGLYRYVRIFEDHAFKILNPRSYFIVSEFIRKRKTSLNRTLKETKDFVTEILEERDIEHDMGYRIKERYSLYNKVIHYHNEFKEEYLKKIPDLAAMRIMVDDVDKCYMVEDILNNLFQCYPDLRDDYILKPKQSGYKSLQSIYKLSNEFDVEIQIKTHDMHETNEFGKASHTFYKLGKSLEKEFEGNPNILKDLNYSIDNRLVMDHFTDKVYVFTPKGDIIELPAGANLIDFAYYIHADLGNSCIGGVVNNEYQKVTYELHNGDRVDVKTSGSKKKPSHDWLELATTKRARSAIRKALKEIKQT
jgi:guanosine-3',5'-bis(diphosphate) 3'-pyrophosphohydrolase